MNNSTVRLGRQAMIDSGGTGDEIKLLKEGVEHIDLKGVEFGETEFNGIKTLTRCFIFGKTTVAAQGHVMCVLKTRK
ncbi:hypothetical protein YC2023_017245 [Brassica napus]